MEGGELGILVFFSNICDSVDHWMESVLTSDPKNNAISPLCFSFCLVPHPPPPLSFLLLLHFISAFFCDTSSLNEICKGMKFSRQHKSRQLCIRAGKGQDLLHDGQTQGHAEISPHPNRAAAKHCSKSHRVLPRTPDTANWEQGDTSANWRDR